MAGRLVERNGAAGMPGCCIQASRWQGRRSPTSPSTSPLAGAAVGAQVGPDAGEIMQGLGVALKCGATKAQFDSCVGIHPSAAEEWVTMSAPAR